MMLKQPVQSTRITNLILQDLTPSTHAKPGFQPSVTRKGRQEGSNTCHGEDYGEMVAQWKEELAEARQEAGEALAAARQTLAGAALSDKAGALKPAACQPEHNLNFVKRAGGLHNKPYATSLLEYVNEQANKRSAEIEAM